MSSLFLKSYLLYYSRRGLKTRASWAMFIVTLFTYAVSTIYWAADLTIIARLLKVSLIDDYPDSGGGLDIQGRIDLAYESMVAANSVSIWASVIPPFIGDAVVVWRAWVLFPDQLYFMILPVMMVLGTTAVSITYVSSYVSSSFSGQINSRLFGASIILSMATNVIATLLIVYKLWSHRKFVNKTLGASRRHSPAQKVLDILVESGLIYCALQIVTLTLDSLPSAPIMGTPYAYAVQVFLCSYTVISAMYPTIVILLVNTQRSFVDTYAFTSHGHPDSEYRPATKGHLSFAAAAGVASMADSESTGRTEARGTNTVLMQEKSFV
ncbi:hypothetical protein H0H92_009372 [Tricholoma furcatifolium]|nr:hypothetical protein H0H92_009372 [Tricholoma furcatifolium]